MSRSFSCALVALGAPLTYVPAAQSVHASQLEASGADLSLTALLSDGAPPLGPGEAAAWPSGMLLVTGYDQASDTLSISYGVPCCRTCGCWGSLR